MNYFRKEHLSNEGGWVINVERKNFCDYEDGCYGKYFKACKEIAHQQTTKVFMSGLRKLITF
jgi:hypothetical protein